MPRKSQATKQRILDAAEALFAAEGFASVTVRQIMRKADADVALAYYHFESKRDLFDAVLLRRAEHLNAIRLAALQEVEQRHPDDAPTVEEIIAAFTNPLLALLGSEHDEWQHYFALIAQVNNSPEWGGELMTRYFDPLVNRFLDALRKALPHCNEEEIFWSYHFLSGALTLTFAETGRLDNLSQGKCSSSDMASIIQRMPVFLAAGFEALCRSNAARARRPAKARSPRKTPGKTAAGTARKSATAASRRKPATKVARPAKAVSGAARQPAKKSGPSAKRKPAPGKKVPH
jgi:AcrR family transcriptional regulator